MNHESLSHHFTIPGNKTMRLIVDGCIESELQRTWNPRRFESFIAGIGIDIREAPRLMDLILNFHLPEFSTFRGISHFQIPHEGNNLFMSHVVNHRIERETFQEQTQ